MRKLTDFEYWKTLPYWSVEEAVCLLLGFDPESIDSGQILSLPYEKPEKPYDEIKRLKERVTRAMRAGNLPEDWSPPDLIKWASEQNIPVPSDLEELKQQGGYSAREIPYLSPQHEYYSLELAAAVNAWMALYKDGGHKNKFGYKSQIEDYLRNHYPELSDRAIERIATVVNPHKRGGAPSTD